MVNNSPMLDIPRHIFEMYRTEDLERLRDISPTIIEVKSIPLYLRAFLLP